MRTLRIVVVTLAAAGLVSTLGRAQLADLQRGRNFTAVMMFGPALSGKCENGDFGDADIDGDLDAVTANGGDGAVAQLARIFINSGTGSFADETATRFAGFPTMGSRDIEFADIESDGDLDVFVANKGSGGGLTGQVSRFFVNSGGVQAGAVGFFQDETATRWGTLSGVLVADQVCGGCNSGPFRDWSCDCDFGDLDDDGDLDLFFSSYGPGFNGTRDSRVFLNDGLGVFNELFPWANAGADIKTHTADFDLADFDGDFDLDVFMSSRNSQARVYLNNLYEPLSASAFNDITPVALTNQGATLVGQNNYEGEYGDVDADGDFDMWLVNYSNNGDRMVRNDGPVPGGFKFTPMLSWITGDPVQDENEVDFGDYDNDGDLDAFMANFSGTNFLYQSNVAQGGAGGGLFHRTGLGVGQAPNPELPSNYNGGQSLDADWADVDNDGDLDIGLFNDNNEGNWLFRNVLGVPDTHAPVLHQLTAQPDKPNGTDTVVHVRAQDNGPGEWLTNNFDWQLVYTVDGGSPTSVSMFGQSGSQARGVIPAQTDALIHYHVEVTDLAGNTSISAQRGFVQGTLALPDPWTDIGFGLAGVAGIPSLVGTGPLTTGSPGTLVLSNAAPSAYCVLFLSLTSSPGPFHCGMLAAQPWVFTFPLGTNGSGGVPLGWASWPSGVSGLSVYFQYAIVDAAATCGVSLSNALRADVP